MIKSMNQAVSQAMQLTKSNTAYAVVAAFLAVSMAGCGGAGADNGQIVNTVELPTDAFTSLYCPDVGVGEENCVLYDPVNPYTRSIINDDTKWDLAADAPSDKSRFYLWATALVKNPTGENQFYTADSLHKIYSTEGSVLAQEQAKRAYRSILDNFYGSVTFASNGTQQFLLRNFVGDRIVAPGGGLIQLFADSNAAIQALDDWGYIYDTNTATMTKKTN